MLNKAFLSGEKGIFFFGDATHGAKRRRRVRFTQAAACGQQARATGRGWRHAMRGRRRYMQYTQVAGHKPLAMAGGARPAGGAQTASRGTGGAGRVRRLAGHGWRRPQAQAASQWRRLLAAAREGERGRREKKLWFE